MTVYSLPLLLLIREIRDSNFVLEIDNLEISFVVFISARQILIQSETVSFQVCLNAPFSSVDTV
jgi:hypothetical protein